MNPASAPATTPARGAIPGAGLSFARMSLVVFVGLAISSWVYVFLSDHAAALEVFSGQTWHRIVQFARDLLGIGAPGTPAFLQWGKWQHTGHLAYDTLIMSVLAIGIAALGALLTMMFGSRNVMLGELASPRSWPRHGLFFVFRGLFTFTRSVPELVWAMLIVFVFSPGIIPGALALGFHNYGILAKLASEVVENADPRPVRALRTTGAGTFQMLSYGILPQVMPQFLTYLLYRWEVIIRTTIVVGFVSAAGLGRDFRLSMSFFHYTDVALLLVWYLVLVVGVDLASAGLRRLAR